MKGVVIKIAIDSETGFRKGFAFIRGDDGREYFVHGKTGYQTTSPRTWQETVEGDRVEFTDIEGPKGWRAIEVRVLV